MEKTRKKIEKIIMYFILFQPIIDVLTSVCVNYFDVTVTFGVIIRMLFMLFSMLSIMFVYKEKKAIAYYFIVILYVLLFLGGVINFKNELVLINELRGLMRSFYFIIMLISIYSIRKKINIEQKWLMQSWIMYIIMIFIPNILNIGFESYEIAKEGSIGFFNSANEISAIISILTPFFFLWLEKKNNLIFKIFIIICYLFVIFSIGTKTPLLALIITMLFLTLKKIKEIIKEKKYKFFIKILSLAVISFLSVLIVLPKTTFYKNIRIHLDFLGVNNVIDIVKEPKLIDHFIFSQRLTFLEQKNNLYKNANSYEKLFGIGYLKDGQMTKMVEMDYFDIYYSHGLIGFIIYFYPYIYILANVYSENKKQKRSVLVSPTNLSILLILLLSFFTGHIVTAPSVSTIAVFVILLNGKNKNEVNDSIQNHKKTKRKSIMEINMRKSENKKEDNEIKVSIIVPIYNSSKYLEKCINSLISQTMKEIEIILINDGSTDNSEKIINSFVDKRIRYFKHKNQGIGKTRNFGIKKSKGEYLIFVDSDDYIKEDMCEKMYDKVKNDNLDIVVCDFYRDNNGVFTEDLIDSFENSSIEDVPELINKINLGPCNKMYNREMIVKNNIKFEESLKYEDVPFVINSILHAKKIGKINESLTYYCIHGNSETTIRDSKMFDILKITEIIRKKITTCQIKIPKQIINHLIVKIITNYTVQQRYQKNRKLRNQFINESFDYLKKYVVDYKNSNYYIDRGFFRSIIEKNKLLTIIYCDIYNVKNSIKP